LYSVNFSNAERTVTLYPWQHAPAHSLVDDESSRISGNCDHFRESYFTFERSVTSIPVHILPFNVSLPADGSLMPANSFLSKTCDNTQSDVSKNQNSETQFELNEEPNEEIRTRENNLSSYSVNRVGDPQVNSTKSLELSWTFSPQHQTTADTGHLDKESADSLVVDTEHGSKYETSPSPGGGISHPLTKTSKSDHGGEVEGVDLTTGGEVEGVALTTQSMFCAVAAAADSKSTSVSTCDMCSIEREGKRKKSKPSKKKETKKKEMQVKCAMQSRDLLRVATEQQLDVAQTLLSVLGDAVRVRVQNQMKYCDSCLKLCLVSQRSEDGGDESGASLPDLTCDHARVGVLFSGGIDSLMIAALADR
jgi:hypothetical protein